MKKKRITIIILLLLVTFITVGYAVLSAPLNINGTSTINNASWNVHFENINVTTGSVAATSGPTIDNSKLNITYAVALEKPGDFFEFTVDVKNAGSVDAKLSELPILDGVSQAQDVYTNYTFTHYDNTAITVGETIAAGSSKKFRVRVEFDRNITANQLPTTQQDMTLTVDMNYEQA